MCQNVYTAIILNTSGDEDVIEVPAYSENQARHILYEYYPPEYIKSLECTHKVVKTEFRTQRGHVVY